MKSLIIIIFEIHHTFMSVSTSLYTYPTKKDFGQTIFFNMLR